MNTTQTECDLPALDRRRQVSITCLVMGVLAAVFFAMRIVSKVIGLLAWGHDDTLISVAFVCPQVLAILATD